MKESKDGSAEASPALRARREIKYDDWYADGVRRFGKDASNWKFKCPMCGNIQTMNDFAGLVKDPSQYAYFSCLGRWKKGVGCDWTLGGLFQIHTLTVNRDGEKFSVFEFSEGPEGRGEGTEPHPTPVTSKFPTPEGKP